MEIDTLICGVGKFIFEHPSAVPIQRTVFIFYGEGLEAKIGTQVTHGQRDVRPDHGTSENEPGIIPLPGIIAGAPEFRYGTNHLPGNDVKLQADPSAVAFLAVVVEPQAALVVTQIRLTWDTQAQAQTSDGARFTTA